MTTYIYKRWKYVAADRKATWGPDGIRSVSKMVRFNHGDYEVVIAMAWKLLLHSVMEHAFKEHCFKEGKFFEPGLYKYREEMLKYDENLEHLAVIKQWSIELAYYMHSADITCTDRWFISGWSGSWYCYGMHVMNEDLLPQEYFKLISKFDSGTSEEFDIHYLSK